MIVTQQKHVPWRWAILAVVPWFYGMFVEQLSGGVLTLTLKKFMDDPATINGVITMNVVFNILVGAVCLYASDRIWSRFGRRKPFLLIGWMAIPLLLFFIPQINSVIPLIIVTLIFLACMDISSTWEPLQQEIVPPKQRGRTASFFMITIQLSIVFTYVIVFGRFDETESFSGVTLSGEHGAYWIGALLMIAGFLSLATMVKEIKPKNSLAGEKISLGNFFGQLIKERTLWPVYLLIFAQSFMATQMGAMHTLLFTEQWDYDPQELGTNIFVGLIITLIVSLITGYLADKFDRIKLYIFGSTGVLIANAFFYFYVQFMLPDNKPELLEIILFGNLVAVFGMISGVVAQPLMYDYIPRNKMGTAAAGISIVRSAVRAATLFGAGLWVTGYSKLFMPEGEYDYFSGYLYIIIMSFIGLLIILNFRRQVKKGKLIAYGRIGLEEDEGKKDSAEDETSEPADTHAYPEKTIRLSSKNLWKLLVLPAIAGVFFFFTYLTSYDIYDKVIGGERAEGTVVGYLRTEPDQNIYIDQLNYTYKLTLASGHIYQIRYEYGDFVSAVPASPETPEPDDALIAKLKEKAKQLYLASPDSIKRFLQRESEEEAPKAISVTVEEHARTVFTTTTDVHVSGEDKDLRYIMLKDGTSLQFEPLLTTLRADFIGGTEEAKELKSEVKTVMTRIRSGELQEEAPAEFILASTSTFTVFQPIINYTVNGETYTDVSSTGKRKQPRNQHRIYVTMDVAYAPEDPEDIVTLADFGAMESLDWDHANELQGTERISYILNTYLGQLNYFFEAVFGRWFYQGVTFIFGVITSIIALVFISLQLFPARTRHSDTVDEESAQKVLNSL